MRKIIIIVVLSLIIFFCVSYYLYNENTSLEISKYIIKNEKLKDFKIAQISDFHNTRYDKLKKDLIKELKKQQPNIIVITGDFIDSRRTNIDICIDFIKEINDICNIYYVPGNHESRKEEYYTLKKLLIENNVIVLENDFEEIKYNEITINLMGIVDPSFYNNGNESLNIKIINDEIENINYNRNNFSILLTHRPEMFSIYKDKEIDLVFAGHAHGGQFRLPLIGGIIAPNQGFFPKYSEGIIKEDSTSMIISRGIGNSLLPFRINNNPELIILEIK